VRDEDLRPFQAAAIRGFERPLEETPDNVLVVDADALASDPPEAPIVTTAATLKITGAADLDMSAAPVTMDYDNFVIDFSTDPLDLSETPPYTELSIPGYTGILTGLTLVDFHTITDGTDPDLWGEVLGNGPAADPVRIDVELDGNVANAANGLKTSGVQTYVVTELNDADRAFWSSEPTLEVETLGLQGNQGYSITFGDVKWGVGFAFLVQAHPQGLLLAVHVLDVHGHRSRDSREGVDHEPDQGSVPQADQGIGRDRPDQLPGLRRRQDRRPRSSISYTAAGLPRLCSTSQSAMLVLMKSMSSRVRVLGSGSSRGA